MWLDCGRPREGPVAESMRRTRATYHYAVRKVKKDQDSIINERVAQSIVTSCDRNFWAEIKKLRSKQAASSQSVDGISEVNGIAQLFAQKYRELYNSVSYDNSEMQTIVDNVNSSLSRDVVSTDCIFSCDDVKDAVTRLKPDKRDGNPELHSDHIINACSEFYSHVACLFTSIAVHGVSPESLLSSTIIPIPKGRNANLTDSANFRGIALSSLFGKLLDNIILSRYYDKLSSCQMQFGFKAKSSTNMCSMVLKETLAYYTEHQTPVFCTFLDATKAFDRVNYTKLFRQLIKRELPSCITRLLVNIYTNNFVRISWCGVASDYFLASNGVKQGAVLSPILFCVYIDNLLALLSKAGFGCYIGSQFVGALAYADDIVLIAPTATALRNLLAICEGYAKEFNISFNVSKSKCLIAYPSSRRAFYEQVGATQTSFYIESRPIEFVDSFVHLGHVISLKLNDDDDIIKKRNDFVGYVNNVHCYFRQLNALARYRLFNSYCTSYYGSELWQLDNHSIDKLSVAWRKGLRLIWKLPNRTHCHLLPMISDCLPVMDEICRRSLNFIRACLAHESPLVRFVARNGVHFFKTISILGKNVMFFTNRYNCSLYSVMHDNINGIVRRGVCHSAEAVTDVNLLYDLIMIRDNIYKLGRSDNNFFTSTELDSIINYICVDQDI